MSEEVAGVGPEAYLMYRKGFGQKEPPAQFAGLGQMQVLEDRGKGFVWGERKAQWFAVSLIMRIAVFPAELADAAIVVASGKERPTEARV